MRFIDSLSPFERVVLSIAVAIAAHFIAIIVRRVGTRLIAAGHARSLSKSRTVVSLVSSIIIFLLYFGAIGLALSEVGVPLGTYLASASIIGFAVAFGSQGIVQDVVTGLTILFTGLFDLGDMVEIGGQVGVVQRFGMRFTVLLNPMGAEVFVPNRSIMSVILYPRGYVRCLVDVTLTGDDAQRERMEAIAMAIARGASEQFPGVLRTNPDREGLIETAADRTILRIKFRVWPGRAGPIENNVRPEIIHALKALDMDYADWMIAVNFEVEKLTVTLGG